MPQLMNNKPQLDPYQEGVKKTLKLAGENHAMEALQQGVPAQDIVKQSGLGQNQNDPAQLLASIIAMSAAQQQGAQQPQAQGMAAQPEMTAIQKQASDIVTPEHRTLFGNILNTLGNITAINPMNAAVDSVRLGNLGKAQSILGQEPLQTGDYQKEIIKQTAELNKQGRLSAGELMTKFEQASQPFITQRDAYARISSLANDPSPAGDLGLIFSYMKLLDPGSTVREGEQATAENARGVPDGIRNLYSKIISGKKLTADQRTDFLKRSKGIFKSIEQQQKKTTSEFARLGKMNNIDPKVFVRDTGLSEEISTPTAKTGGNKIGRFTVEVQ